MPGFASNQPNFGDQWLANLRHGGMPAGGLGPAVSPGMDDVARLRQERAIRHYEQMYGRPHPARQNTPALSQGQMAAMITRIRQARGMR